MIKRLNKVTSLVASVAAMATLVPATGVMASDYERIDSNDGIIYSAVAYDGAFIIDGEVDDDDAVFFVEDGKYTELEDVDSGDDLEVYGEKYVDVDDADYYIDMTDGSVTDDSIEEDLVDDAAVAMRKEAKDIERYDEEDDMPTMTALKGNKFSTTWYETSYSVDEVIDGITVTNTYKVYADGEGNYIDADYNLGKVKVSTTDDSVTLTNTEDSEELEGKDTTAAVSDAKYIGQDEDNIYRIVTVTVTGTGLNEVYGKAGDAITFAADETTATFKAIQRISKEQDSDDIDDAKYSKSVTTYVIADEDGDTSEDADNFATLAENEDANFSVNGGKLVVSLAGDDSVEAQAVSLKSTHGFYYTDAEGSSTEDSEAVDTDVDGNVYRLDSGYVYKFDNTDDWDKVYKVDGSMESMSVYNEDNIVVWNEDDEVYSIITEEAAVEEETETETEVETPVVSNDWITNADGTWSFVKADGTKAIGWLQSPFSGAWYYMDAQGTMLSNGWIQDGSNWYFLKSDGAMATGWMKSPFSGKWYYLNNSGAMMSNTTVGGYVLGSDGAWIA